MSNLNAMKPYELSIWEDVLEPVESHDINVFREVKIATIATDTMQSQNRAFDINLTQKTDGTNEVTFSMYYLYKDHITGEDTENPFCSYLTNERKLKLYYDDNWYDLIIKSCKKDSKQHKYEISASDLYINELSKNGFNITLDAELNNNLGSVSTLAESILDGTGWTIADNSEFISDKRVETVVHGWVSTGFNAYHIIDDNAIQAPHTEVVPIPASAFVHAFYSDLTTKPNRFEFIYTNGDDISVDDERIINNPNCVYYVDLSEDQYLSTQDEYGFYWPTFMTIATDEDMSYQGKKYQYSEKMSYSPLLKQYVTEVTSNNITYVKYDTTEYKVPTLITNLTTNPNSFKTTSGWKTGFRTAVTAGTQKGDLITAASRYDADTQSLHTLLDDMKNQPTQWQTYAYTSYLQYTQLSAIKNTSIVLNTGFRDNRGLIGTLVNGKRYHIALKYASPKAINWVLGDFTYDATTNQYTLISTFANGTIPQGGSTTTLTTANYTTEFAIANCNLTVNEYKAHNIYFAFYITTDTNVQTQFYDFQVYEEVHDSTGAIVTPESQQLEASVITTTHFYLKSDIDNAYTKGLTMDDVIESNAITYTPILSCEKRRAISAKESNYFNILQTICEKFECWMTFELTRDIYGGVTNKAVSFHNYIGRDNYAGFRYGSNLQSIQRSDDSKSIVTKLIVKANSNEFATNGFCTITRAASNPTGENYLYDMRYYLANGLLDRQLWFDEVYNTTNAQGADIDTNAVLFNSKGCFTRLKRINALLRKEQESLNAKYLALAEAQAKANTYKTGRDAAAEELESAIATFEAITGFPYNATYTTAQRALVDDMGEKYLVAIGEAYQALKNYSTKYGKEIIDGYYYSGQFYKNISFSDIISPDSTKTYFDLRTNGYYSCNGTLYTLIDKTILAGTYAFIEHENALIYNAINATIETYTFWKNAINSAFYRKFYRYIQEGTWNSEEYYDDEKYCVDAINTLYNSAIPKASYTINVLELSQIPEYADFQFALGDKTYIEDTEFFGYTADGNPKREEVVLSEIKWCLTDPSKNSIKVQTYKSVFQDLFKKITATVQSVQYSTGSYDKAAALAASEQPDRREFLQGALQDAGTVITNSAEQSVVINDQGLTITDKLEPNKMLRAVGGAIALSEDSGESWMSAMTPNGISANVINSGTLNTAVLNIMYGSDPTFRWDAYGLNAYAMKVEGEGEAKQITSVDPSRGIRFDHFGLYEYHGHSGQWRPSSLNEILEHSDFGIARDLYSVTSIAPKFWMKSTVNQVAINISTDDGIKITKGTEDVFYVDTNGNLCISGTITAKDGDIGGWKISQYGLTSDDGGVGLISDTEYPITDHGYIRFYAGSTTPSSAPIYITSTGLLHANSIEITGGTLDIGSGAFTVSNAGAVSASNLSITGGSIDIKNGTNTMFSVSNIGALMAKSGTIGGWQLGADILRNGASIKESTVGMRCGAAYTATSLVTAKSYSPLRFYAGGDGEIASGSQATNENHAKFVVTDDGSLYAAAAKISGNITSSSGTIGGFTLSSTAISNGPTSVTAIGMEGVYIGKDGMLISDHTDASGHYMQMLVEQGLLTTNNLKAEGGSINQLHITGAIYFGNGTTYWLNTGTSSSLPYVNLPNFKVDANGIYSIGGTIGGLKIDGTSLHFGSRPASGQYTWDGIEIKQNIIYAATIFAGQQIYTEAGVRTRGTVLNSNGLVRSGVVISGAQTGTITLGENLQAQIDGMSAESTTWHKVIVASNAYTPSYDTLNTKATFTAMHDKIFDNLRFDFYKDVTHQTSSTQTHARISMKSIQPIQSSPNLSYYGLSQLSDTVDITIDHFDFVALNTWQIQKLKSRIAELETRLAKLESQ